MTKIYGRPRSVDTDGLGSYVAAMKMKEIGNADRQEVGRRLNNRAEKTRITRFDDEIEPCNGSEARRRYRKFSSVHAQVHNRFN